jgi:hypothetical protein
MAIFNAAAFAMVLFDGGRGCDRPELQWAGVYQSQFFFFFASRARLELDPGRCAPPPPPGENRASGQDVSIGSAADYIRTLNQAVPISSIGMYVRDGRTELIDGHEVNGVEVIDAGAESPPASSGIQSCRNGRESSSRTGSRARRLGSTVTFLLNSP